LAKHSLSLDADTFDAVNNDESSIGHAEGGSHLGRKVDVAWGVDEVDEVRGVSFAADFRRIAFGVLLYVRVVHFLCFVEEVFLVKFEEKRDTAD